MSLRTRVPATGAGTSSQKPCIDDTRTRTRTRSGHFRWLVQCQLVGSLAIPTSCYSASSPGGSPDKLVLHQLARRAPSKLVLHKFARRAPSKLVLHRLARRAPGKLVLHRLARRALGKLLQCQLAGSSAIPTSWYSARSPGGSPDELVLHQLARRAPEELVLHQLARRAPEELVLHQLARRAPKELVLHQLARRAPGELIRHQLPRRALGEAIRHQLPRRALGELALYQLFGSWQAGIFLPACQGDTLVSWYGMYQLAKRHSQRAGTLPALQEVLPARWYSASLPGGCPNELLLISAHQESPEYSAPACWGSAGKRFCRS
ncbi:hypothetical protein PCASD_25284 [Puccinia coronata f. sp. avenae]|uniref:Uncharacterized protein n=1 Tax=Puccinia coronata f. sp. avenae TaxID=200324 RepID=A0A2N5RX91_9BASI|nr:hypothetical protein PCASD_25284 [Puccinia coronata f. sp. avenae]